MGRAGAKQKGKANKKLKEEAKRSSSEAPPPPASPPRPTPLSRTMSTDSGNIFGQDWQADLAMQNHHSTQRRAFESMRAFITHYAEAYRELGKLFHKLPFEVRWTRGVVDDMRKECFKAFITIEVEPSTENWGNQHEDNHQNSNDSADAARFKIPYLIEVFKTLQQKLMQAERDLAENKTFAAQYTIQACHPSVVYVELAMRFLQRAIWEYYFTWQQFGAEGTDLMEAKERARLEGLWKGSLPHVCWLGKDGSVIDGAWKS